MTEKYEVISNNPLKKAKFSLMILDTKKNKYLTCFQITVKELGNNYEFLSDTFSSESLYKGMLRAFCEGKKVLKKNKIDTKIADEAFAIFQDKTQLKFAF